MANNEKMIIELQVKVDQATKSLKILEKSFSNVEKSSKGIDASFKTNNKLTKSMANNMNNLGSSIFKANVISNLFTDGLYLAGEMMKRAIVIGFNYAVEMEKLQLAMTSVIYATSEMRNEEGKLLSVQEKNAVSYSLAIAQRQRLVDINKETITTLQNTVRIFNTMAPSLRKSGASYEQIEVLTKSIANSSIAFTGTFQQVLAIIDGIGDGTYRANSEYGRFLNNLGVSTTKIQELKQNGGDVAGYLIKQFEAIEANNERLQKTFVQNFNEFKSLSEQGLGGLAEGLKDTFADILGDVNDLLRDVDFDTLSKKSELFFNELRQNINYISGGAQLITNTLMSSINVLNDLLNKFDKLTLGSGNILKTDFGFDIKDNQELNDKLREEEELLEYSLKLLDEKNKKLLPAKKILEEQIKVAEKLKDQFTIKEVDELKEKLKSLKVKIDYANNFEELELLRNNIKDVGQDIINLNKELNNNSLSKLQKSVISEKIKDLEKQKELMVLTKKSLLDLGNVNIGGIVDNDSLKDQQKVLDKIAQDVLDFELKKLSYLKDSKEKEIQIVKLNYGKQIVAANGSKEEIIKAQELKSLELIAIDEKYAKSYQNQLDVIALNVLDFEAKKLSYVKDSKEKEIQLVKYNFGQQVIAAEKNGSDIKELIILKNLAIEKIEADYTQKNKEELDKRLQNEKALQNEIALLKIETNTNLSSGDKTLLSGYETLNQQRELDLKGIQGKEDYESQKALIEEKYALKTLALNQNALKEFKRVEDEKLEKIKQNQNLIDDIIGELKGGLNMTFDERQNYEMEKLQAALDEKIQKLRDAGASEIEIKEAIALKTKTIDDAMREQMLEKVRAYSQHFGDLSSGMSSMMDTFSIKSKAFFRAQQAAGIASATMNMFVGISENLKLGMPMAIPAIAATMAQGIATIGQIRAQKPKFHDGGFINQKGGTNEVDATLQSGEGVLSRRGMMALDKMNRGETGNNGNVEIIMVNNMEEAINRQLQSRTGRAIIKQVSN